MPPSLPPSFVARVQARIAASASPIVRLWGWPASGRQALLAALAATSGGPWRVRDREPATSELLAAAAELTGEARLIYPAARRRRDAAVPEHTIEPQELLLTPGEVAEMFQDLAAPEVDALAQASDGWYGPLAWLRDHGALPISSATAAWQSAGFRSWCERRVLAELPSEVRRTLGDVAAAPELDPELWRLVWLDEPERLAGLERLLGEWRLVVTSSHEPWRLPRPLSGALARRDDGEVRALCRRLGVAAASLGRRADAAALLRRGGDGERAALLERSDAGDGVGASPLLGEGETDGGPRYRLTLLGVPSAQLFTVGGGEVELAWRLRRAFQTVAFLALRPGRRATKDELIEALWPDAGQQTIRKNFHPTLSEARRTLAGGAAGEPIVFRQGAYLLNPELGWEVDCQRFGERIDAGRELLAAGAAEPALVAWRDAWHLYRGPLLNGHDAPWITVLRDDTHRAYLRLLRDLGELGERLGEETLALDAYRSLLLEEPFEERVHLAVMGLYARQGRRDLVRRQYVKLQELLLKELNVEPLAETQELFHQLMR